MEEIRIRTILEQVKEDGIEATIKAIEETLNNPYWIMSTIDDEYVEGLKKAKKLLEQGKLEEIKEIDEDLKDLIGQSLFD